MKHIKRTIMISCALISSQVIAETPSPPASAESKIALKAGMPAPAINLAGIEWLKGEPLASLDEKGKLYVIECWATWCTPCIKSIPHINDLHVKFADKGLVVVGMNVFEDGVEKAKSLMAKQGDAMSYRVAYSGGTESEFSKRWLKAAGVTGIPSAFLVKDGKLLLITHPNEITAELVTKILNGDSESDIKAMAQRKEEVKARYAEIRALRAPYLKARDWEGLRDFALNGLTPEQEHAKAALLSAAQKLMIDRKSRAYMKAKDLEGLKKFVNTEMKEPWLQDWRNELLLRAALAQNDWAALKALVDSANSDAERREFYTTNLTKTPSSPRKMEATKDSAEIVNHALTLFSSEYVEKSKTYDQKFQAGHVRIEGLRMNGRNDEALDLVKTLMAESESVEDLKDRNKYQKVLKEFEILIESHHIRLMLETLRQAGNWEGVKVIANAHLTDEKFSEMKTDILVEVAIKQNDWLAIQALTTGKMLWPKKMEIYQDAFENMHATEDSGKIIKTALSRMFTEKSISSKEIVLRYPSGKARVQGLALIGDREGALTFARKLHDELKIPLADDYSSYWKARIKAEAKTIGELIATMEAQDSEE
ncbi:TlpA family protein disulfide reductase [Akkermansiaceae bacterium]|nr:TlpA family protein disulfide reductase [Akkermansiaceae bacterium]